MKAVRLRPLAEEDLAGQARYYRSVSSSELGDRFLNAAVASLDAIAAMPQAGSPRSAELTGVPHLRSRTIAGFKCGWFYLERADHIDVVRLIAYSQDLASVLRESD